MRPCRKVEQIACDTMNGVKFATENVPMIVYAWTCNDYYLRALLEAEGKPLKAHLPVGSNSIIAGSRRKALNGLRRSKQRESRLNPHIGCVIFSKGGVRKSTPMLGVSAKIHLSEINPHIGGVGRNAFNLDALKSIRRS